MDYVDNILRATYITNKNHSLSRLQKVTIIFIYLHRLIHTAFHCFSTAHVYNHF